MNAPATANISATQTRADTPAPQADFQPVSPGRRIWRKFKQHRLGYYSLIIFLTIYGFSLVGEIVSNDKPLVVRYQGEWFFPLVKDYPETTFGGELPTTTHYLDPFVKDQFSASGNFALYPLNPFYYNTLNYFSVTEHFPGPPNKDNWLGTDSFGYDMTARLIYGFRVSVTFALGLTIVGTLLGILIGAVQGYFAGRTDLFGQRVIEVWSSMPELYLLIIFASMFEPSFMLLFILLSLFGWITLSDYVRVEFLRNRQLEYVKAARAMGLSHWQIIRRHILPNSLTPVITFLPFRMSAGIMALASLDFLGLGVETPAPSLGNLLAQGKNNLDAWWISLATFTVLIVTLLLLTFMGEALRNALDTRVADKSQEEADDEAQETVVEITALTLAPTANAPVTTETHHKPQIPHAPGSLAKPLVAGVA